MSIWYCGKRGEYVDGLSYGKLGNEGCVVGGGGGVYDGGEVKLFERGVDGEL